MSGSNEPLSGGRLFYLSEARQDRLAHLALFDDEPSYDDLKMMVCEYIVR